jgi:hypothetical protein
MDEASAAAFLASNLVYQFFDKMPKLYFSYLPNSTKIRCLIVTFSSQITRMFSTKQKRITSALIVVAVEIEQKRKAQLEDGTFCVQ